MMIRQVLIDARGSMSLDELAKALDVSKSMVEKVEKGTRRASIDLAKRWAKFLNIADIWGAFYADPTDNMCVITNLQPTGSAG